MNASMLKAEIIRNGMTQQDVAKAIGMSESTFWRKMKSQTFGLDEANALIRLLGIKNPSEIFFDEN